MARKSLLAQVNVKMTEFWFDVKSIQFPCSFILSHSRLLKFKETCEDEITGGGGGLLEMYHHQQQPVNVRPQQQRQQQQHASPVELSASFTYYGRAKTDDRRSG